MSGKTISIGLVGDLMVNREVPNEPFAKVADLLRAPDVLFGNLEGTYSDHPNPPPGIFIQLFPAARLLDVFSQVGFSVLSMANNHIVDNGHAAMLENMARLQAQGVRTCGAGHDLASAREPAILEVGGVRLAFLAYASMFPMGYEAGIGSPGLAPYRSYDHWQPQLDNYYAPGMPPKVQSVPNRVDLGNLRQDIKAARQRADLVFTSFHWGDVSRPFHLTDHELETARLCIDEGADMVIGHHHHALRGMEWYKGKPILYGLGHFVFDFPAVKMDQTRAQAIGHTGGGSRSPAENYGIYPREGWPLLPMHPDMRMTAFFVAEIRGQRVAEIGAVPCRLRPNGQVEAVEPESEEGLEVLDYLDTCISTQRLNAKIARHSRREIAGRKMILVREPVAESL